MTAAHCVFLSACHWTRCGTSTSRCVRTAREQVKQVIEGPDSDIDRIIRSVRENGGTLTKKLLKEFPSLADDLVATDVVNAIDVAFADFRQP